MPNGRHFDLKGKRAEQLLYSLATKSFLEDWCYLNPRLPNGKELCDLLVVFDDQVIIWQIKDLKLGKDGRWSRSEVAKNLRQLRGARRRLLDSKTSLCLENTRRGSEVYDPTTAKRVFLISAMLGGEEDYYSMSEQLNDGVAHNFTRASGEIILGELDTVADFLAYYEAREDFLSTTSRVIVNGGGEEELLAIYLEDERSFAQLKSADLTVIEGGRWSRFAQSDQYKARARANEISYGWDSIIGRAHEGGGQYEIIARELARPNRVMRRGLAEAFAGAALKADRDQVNNVMRRVIATDGTTYCFQFMDETIPREHRRLALEGFCFVARGTCRDNTRIVGIGTEKTLRHTCTYDYVYLEMPDWTSDDESRMKEIQDKLKILVKPVRFRLDVKEYPTTDQVDGG